MLKKSLIGAAAVLGIALAGSVAGAQPAAAGYACGPWNGWCSYYYLYPRWNWGWYGYNNHHNHNKWDNDHGKWNGNHGKWDNDWYKGKGKNAYKNGNWNNYR
jgi:hypothetical protein